MTRRKPTLMQLTALVRKARDTTADLIVTDERAWQIGRPVSAGYAAATARLDAFTAVLTALESGDTARLRRYGND